VLLTIVVQEVLVRTVPDLGGNRAALVQVHTHTLFLRTLASEDVSRDGLLDLGLTEKDLLLSLGLGSLNLDDLTTRHHSDVLEGDLDGVIGEDHTDEAGVEAAHTTDVVLCGPSLDERTDSGARVHTVSDGTGQVGVLGEHARNVDRVVVARHLRVGLVGSRSLENERRLAVKRNWVLEVHGLVERSAVAAQVVKDGVAERGTGLVLDGCDLDDLLRGQLKLDLTDGLHGGEDSLVLVPVEGLEPEDEGLTEELNVSVFEAEPFLRLQDGNVLGGLEVDFHRGLHLALEGVLVVGVGTAVQELRGDLHDGGAIASDGAADLDQLAGGLVDDSVDLCGGVEDVALLQRCRPRKHAEAVGQVNKLEEITVNLAREDGLGDGLPADDNCKVHGSEDLLAGSVNESLASVANGVDEVVDGLAGDGGPAALETGSNRSVERNSLVTEPDAVVELLDAVVAGLHDLTDRGVTSLWVVCEPQSQSLGLARGSAVLDHLDDNLVVRHRANLDGGHVLAVRRLLHDDNGALGVIRVGNLNQHARGGREDAVHRVGLETLTLHENIGGEESVAP
jgi:hypothetical protein